MTWQAYRASDGDYQAGDADPAPYSWEIQEDSGNAQKTRPHMRSLYVTQLAIRLLILATNLIILCLIGARETVGRNDVFWFYGGIPTGTSIIWTVTDMIVMATRSRGSCFSRNRSADLTWYWGHPGLHLAMQLCLWIIAAIMGAFLALSIHSYWGYAQAAVDLAIAAAVFTLVLM
jgi:hypothetical protein